MRILVLLIALVEALPGVAQSWFPEGATWQHEYWNVGAFIGYTRMVAEADTLLGGEQARVLRRETVAAFVEPPHDWGISPLGPFIVHESNGLVRIWEDGHETFAVLYDMNAVPGDQWPMALPYSFNACDTTSFVQVLDTGTVVLNDVPLRWLAVERNYILFGEPWFIEADTVIERIGYTTGYFAPHDACNAGVDGDDGRELRCYTDDVISYKRIQPWSCESLLTVSEATAELGAGLVPLGDGAYRVQLPAAEGAVQFTLFDASGRQLQERSVRDGDVIVMPQQGKGVYQYLDQQAQVIGRGRVVWP
jgi:hypothetical protein